MRGSLQEDEYDLEMRTPLNPIAEPSRLCVRTAAGLFVLAILLGAGTAGAQTVQTAVCSNTPDSSVISGGTDTVNRVECEELATKNGETNADAIDLDLDQVTIVTTTNRKPGVSAWNRGGTGDIDISFTNGSITTSGGTAYGISALHDGAGDITIDLDDATVATSGVAAYGVYARHQGSGGIDIRLTNTAVSTWADRGDAIRGVLDDPNGSENQSDLRIEVTGGAVTTHNTWADGVYGYTEGNVLEISLNNVDITTESTAIADPAIFRSTFSHGIHGQHRGAGDLDIDARGGSITTKGKSSYGIHARHQGAGNVAVRTLSGHSISTTGARADGIVAYHQGAWQGPAGTDMRRMDITVGGPITVSGADTQGVRVGYLAGGVAENVAALDADGDLMQTVTVNGRITSGAEGVFMAGGGRVVIGPGGSIASGSGIAILASGKTRATTSDQPQDGSGFVLPRLRVDLNLGGRRVAQALGDGWIVNDNGVTTIAVNNVVLHDGDTGVTGRTASNGAWNVSMRPEGVMVTDRTDPDPANWVVSDPAEGVIADRDFSAADFNERRRLPPLSFGSDAVDLTLREGRTIEAVVLPEATGGDGDFTYALTSDPPGLAGLVFDPASRTLSGTPTANGEYVFTYRADSDAAVLTFKVRVETPLGSAAAAVRRILKRTLAAVGTRALVGALGQRGEALLDAAGTGGAPVSPAPEPPVIMVMEEYAPRAAVYEALPGFLLSLDAPGFLDGRRIAAPGSPAWARISGGRGAYEPGRANVGAEYDFSRFAAEAGLDFSIGERATGSVSVRSMRGSADVKSSVGGGKIEADGFGAALGVSVNGPDAWYARGRLSLADYSANLSSSTTGNLKRGAGARANSLDFEAGRRMAMRGKMNLTPRVRVTRSAVDVDGFTDSMPNMPSRVTVKDASRVTGAVGMAAETARARNWRGGELTLRGSLDLARTLSGAETSVDVSGERLASEPAGTRLLLGLGGTWRRGRFSVTAEVSADGLGSGDAEYAGRIAFGWKF